MTHNFFVLAKKLGELCVSESVQIALAESCTGGKVAAVITDVAGCSAWFKGGAVVYSNAAKITLLGVDPEIITLYGAVSEETASAMATGALRQFQSDLALSITGVAGPQGGTVEKPVGMVCFALADIKGVDSITHMFTGGRNEIRQCASAFALEWLIERVSLSVVS